MPKQKRPDILAVVGSRDFDDYRLVCKILDRTRPHTDRIISGGAKGADSLAERYAKENGVDFEVFKPGKEYGPPMARNSVIADTCTRMLAFWNGVSPGTKDVITKAVRRGKVVVIIPTTRGLR